jgi:hypothetical protein
METERNGYKLVIMRDAEPENPREKYNLGDMFFIWDYGHLSDESDFKNEKDFSRGDLWDDVEIILEMYTDDSDGLRISTTPFKADRRPSGRIVATYDKIKYWFGTFTDETMDITIQTLQREVAEYNDYINDNTLRFSVYSPERRCIDSIGGFPATAPAEETINAMREAANKRNRFLFDALMESGIGDGESTAEILVQDADSGGAEM